MSVHRPDATRGESVKPSAACDTSFSPGSLNAARRAVGGMVTAVDRVLTGRNRNAFCVVGY
jgi:acetoin utilization deacetylase AcuC-like enzyme